jgi:hypothetical protein
LWFVFCVKIKDILRDCRKSPKMAILAISHVIKSMTYKHQIHRFRVFRQSLRISPKRATCDMQKYHNFWGPVNFADMLDHRFENRKEKRNLNKYELQFEMRTSLSFLSSRTICVKSARLIHFKSLHQNTG